MSADRPRTPDDDEFDRIVAGIELSVPPADPQRAEETPEQDVFDPRMSDRLEHRHDDEDVDEPDDERFVPPDPRPAPPLDTPSRLAWAGMVGAPGLMVVATVVGYTLPRSVAVTLILVAVASVLFLLVRRGNEDHGSGPDHGAVL